MTNEEAILKETESIIAAALAEETKHEEDSLREAIILAEQQTWQAKPMTDDSVYDLWVFTKQFQGTPEELAEFRKTMEAKEPDAISVEGSAWQDGRANACISLEHLFSAVPDKTPVNIKEVLSDASFVMGLHCAPRFEEHRVEGLMIRSLASARAVDEGKGTEDVKDIVMTAVVLGDKLAVIPRLQATGELWQEPVFTTVVRLSDDNAELVKECWSELDDSHGEVAKLLYGALNMPRVLQQRDPEIWEAMKQDFLAGQAKEDEQE